MRWMTHQCGSMGLRMQGGKAGRSEVIRERGGSEGITMTYIYSSVQLSGKRLSGTAWVICDKGEAPTLITGRVGGSGTDRGERVHSPCGINLWTTFKVFIEVPQGD